MIRSRLVRATNSLPASINENGSVIEATLFPAYAKGDGFDYENALNKPTINGVVIKGNLTLADLGIVEASKADLDDLFKTHSER